MKPKIYIILPAGGSGTRFGNETKKQFLELNGESVLDLTIQKFLVLDSVAQIVVALPEEDFFRRGEVTSPKVWETQPSLQNGKLKYVIGGATRAVSVKNAFLSLQDCDPDDVVLVHDAVRPLISKKVIERVISGVLETGAAIAAMPVKDTIKKVQGDTITETVDREQLRAAQTPQGARFSWFQKAFLACLDLSQITDEAMLLENAGYPVQVVEGDPKNLKITTSFDLEVAKMIGSTP